MSAPRRSEQPQPPEPHGVAVTAGLFALAGFLAAATLGAALGSRWGVLPGLALFFLVGFVGQRLGALLGRAVAYAWLRVWGR